MGDVIAAEPGWYAMKAWRARKDPRLGVVAYAKRVVGWNVRGGAVLPLVPGEVLPLSGVEVEYHPEWISGQMNVLEHDSSGREYDEHMQELMIWAMVVVEEKAEAAAS